MEDQIKKVRAYITMQPYRSVCYSFVAGLVLGILLTVGFITLIARENYQTFEQDINVDSVAEGSPEITVNKGSQSVKVTDGSSAIDYSTENEFTEKYCVDIAGAVKKPGVYCITREGRLVDILEKAGGFEKALYASDYVSRKFNFSQKIIDQQKIYIPFLKEVSCSLYGIDYIRDSEVIGKDVVVNLPVNETNPFIQDPQDLSSESIGQDNTNCIDINKATKDQLVSISGIGDATAQKIIDARPFSSNEELLNVSGIGEAKYATIEPYLCK